MEPRSGKWWLIVGTGLVLIILALTYMMSGTQPLTKKV